MAEVINIENSKYEFEILLFKRVIDPETKDVDYKAVPITKSSIKLLEIKDDLVNFGYTGTITFTNYFGLLQKLGMFSIEDEAPLISIRFKNLDFEEAKKAAPPVYFIGSLGKNYESSTNVIDKHATFEFEEYSVAKLKRITVESVLESESTDDASIQQDNTGSTTPSLLFGDFTPVDLARRFLNRAFRLLDITSKVRVLGTPIDAIIGPGYLDVAQNKYSVFEALQKLSNFLAFTLPDDIPSALSSYVAPGIIKIENTPDNKDREVVIKSLVGEIRDFFKLIIENKNSKDISSYLTEKFVISLSNDSRTYRDNFISKYDLIRVNYEDVYENKWCNLDITTGTNDCTYNPFIPYELSRVAFEKIFTAPFATNLPRRTKEFERSSGMTQGYSLPQIPEQLAIGFGTNALFKSFIFDNVALAFRVKGQSYRTAGKFIQIEADGSRSSGNSKNKKSSDELNGYWYIISIKHVFENDIYFNDYICVKIYSNVGELSDIPASTLQPGPNAAPSILPQGGDGEGVFRDFVEPDLPEVEEAKPDGGLLPPKPPSTPDGEITRPPSIPFPKILPKNDQLT